MPERGLPLPPFAALDWNGSRYVSISVKITVIPLKLGKFNSLKFLVYSPLDSTCHKFSYHMLRVKELLNIIDDSDVVIFFHVFVCFPMA